MRNGNGRGEADDFGRDQLRILVVDDHAGTRRAMELLLRWLRCRTDLAENGQEAVDATRARDYDLIFMDVVMARMDGLEATRRIRKDCAKSSGPRIVGMSADAAPEDREICLAAGMDAFLAKPIDVDSLIRILDEAALGVVAFC